MISDPQELYRFLAMPRIEVENLLFASDKDVWASCRYIHKEKIPSIRHTNEVIKAFVTAGDRQYLTLISTDCRKKTCSATPIVCSTYSERAKRPLYPVEIS
jgi:hypothetical protein